MLYQDNVTKKRWVVKSRNPKTLADIDAVYRLFTMQLLFGLVAFGLQLPFSIRKDIRRIKDLRYGRRLKGPVLVNGKQFTKAVAGNGIGITTNDSKLPLRIPRDAENKHFLIVGDTGSGKSSVIRQMLYQVESRGDSAIVYDPACEFVKQFYSSTTHIEATSFSILLTLECHIGIRPRNCAARPKQKHWRSRCINQKGCPIASLLRPRRRYSLTC
jgi:hypothetical protein